MNSNTSLTLAYPWKGAAQTAAAYEIQFTPYDVGYQAAVRALLTTLASGNVDALAELPLTADKLPYATGAGTMALTALTAFARSLLDDANAAAFWTTIGATAPADKAFRRGNVLGAVSEGGGVPTGALIERGANANGIYARFADGTQFCSGVATLSYVSGLYLSAIGRAYPAAFSSYPYVGNSIGAVPSGRSGLDIGYLRTSGGLTSMNYFLYNTNSTFMPGDTMDVAFVAIGGWN